MSYQDYKKYVEEQNQPAPKRPKIDKKSIARLKKRRHQGKPQKMERIWGWDEQNRPLIVNQ